MPCCRRCISAFFSAYPTPSAFASAVIDSGDTSALRELVHSLGLFDDRLRSLTAITTAFLSGPDAFTVGLEPSNKVHGVGKFGVHSFLIFCRDQGAQLRPEDKALASFCNWRRTCVLPAEGTDGSPGPTDETQPAL